ncbi:30S ribosomal protein S13 [Patescibacteria group bacterium]|nr:30S ribosomal protein S13 [Patescibacteria group bacterium]MCG2702430.1 30S ribosomal protein S13 [Candidatus Parcubacteria bacterium]MBU4210330.1 30S ribosomal protein S13 [Patescibacteria group bacterium]MBU4264520.1 30S ribosomal protein S13 [Patescibacteria group bacterium]MBU4390451.1 30S ribosomal protein S13 [Patescibacteria group bacterium]
MRISGINIPDHERVEIAFTRFFGIGKTLVKQLLQKSKIDPDKRTKDLSREEVSNLIKALESFKTEGDLRREIREDIKRLKAIKSYRGIRHIVDLPVRGQRTKTNARTRKGKRKTVGSLSKEAWAKLDSTQSRKP